MFVSKQRGSTCALMALALGTGLLLFAATTKADEFYWINPAGGDTSDPENWSPEGPPGLEDVAIFDLGSPGYSIDHPGVRYLNNIRINNDSLTGLVYLTNRISVGYATGSNGTVLLDRESFRVNVDRLGIEFSPEGGLWVGEQGNGHFAVTNTSQVEIMGQIVVADGEDSVGQLTIDNSMIDDPRGGEDEYALSTTIARRGTGSMTATNGSRVLLNGTMIVGQEIGSNGSIVVNDSYLEMFDFSHSPTPSTTIGAAGNGSLTVENQADVNFMGMFTLGEEAGSQGTVTVDNSDLGAGLTSTYVGGSGTGSLTATNGAEIGAQDLVVGRDAGSQGTVTVDDSSIEAGRFTIGAAGTGSLTLLNGSEAGTDGNFIVGQAAGSIGMVTVDMSTLGYGYLDSAIIGAAGNGTLAATNGAELNIGGSLIIGQEAGAKGVVTVDDSLVEIDGYLDANTIGGGGNGSLAITNESEVVIYGESMIGKEAGSLGTVSVDNSIWNANHEFITVGVAGHGSFEAANGAEVILGETVIAKEAGSQGMVNVDGAKMYTSNVMVGVAGHGSIAATNGADIMLESLSVGIETGSHGTVTVNGSNFQSDGYVSIGYRGSGSFTITNESDVKLRGLDIGERTGSYGEVMIENSTFEAEQIVVGGVGTGKLAITDGAIATVSYDLIVVPNGLVEIDAAALETDGVRNYGSFHNDGLVVGNIFNDDGGVLSGNGMIEGYVSLGAGSEIAPGNSPGTLTAERIYWGGDATFRFMINGAEGEVGSEPGWNSMLSTGGLFLSTSQANPMRVSLESLLPNNEAGDVFDFNPEKSYLWTFATATEGISGFSPENFIIDTTDFSNPIGDGYFEIRQIDNSLAVAFVPEPSTWLLALIGAVGLVARGRCVMRRR